MKTLASETPFGVGGASLVVSSLVLAGFLWLLAKPASSVTSDSVGLPAFSGFVQDKSGGESRGDWVGDSGVEIKLLLHRLDRLPAVPTPLDAPALAPATAV